MFRKTKPPLFIVATGVAACLMLVMAVYALVHDDFRTARGFFYHALAVGVVLTAALILVEGRPRRGEHANLAALFSVFILMPAVLALPFRYADPSMGFVAAYFEMVSSLTTTGASLFAPDDLSQTLHLWRAVVAWSGGFIIWVAALGIMAPLNLGGFEVLTADPVASVPGRQGLTGDHARDRILRIARRLSLPYFVITAALAFLLILAGENGFVASVHAMSVISTSGISPVGGLEMSASGRGGEIIVILFFIFALSHGTFSGGQGRGVATRLAKDPEIRLAFWLIVTLTLLVFGHHWIGAGRPVDQGDARHALSALWGSIFTLLSFLTTTGFASRDWLGAEAWSGLQAPGLLLMFLALLGGGFATTAGGIKLIRLIAIFRHGQRELNRLVHPSMVGGGGPTGRSVRMNGAYLAWVFFILFVLSLGAIVVLLSLTGVSFEHAFILSIAGLSTTGPVAAYAEATPIFYSELGGAAQMILAGAMVLGRLETLAIVALLNPDFWR